jgi:hypothetical protein
MSESIYAINDRVCFTYKLEFNHRDFPNTLYYYGSKTAKGCHPTDIWTSYFTSSKTVKELILKYGKECFTVVEVMTHDNAQTARQYEVNYLTNIDAAKNDLWLNKHNGGAKFSTAGVKISRKKSSILKMLKTKELNGTLKTNTPESIRKMLETKAKNGTSNNGNSPDAVIKRKATLLQNGTYGNCNSPLARLKASETNKRNGKLRKHYLIITPLGEQLVVTNLMEYCNEQGLSKKVMHNVVAGRKHLNKGYDCYKIEEAA